jgi:hypothetical protein
MPSVRQVAALVGTMSMDRSQWSSGVRQTQQDIQQLNTGLDQLAAKSKQSTGGRGFLNDFMGGSGGGVGDFTRGIAQSVAGVSLLAGGAAAAGITVAKLGQELANAGIGGNAAFEQYQVSMGVLLHSTEAAEARMKELWDFAAHTPFEMGEVVRADRVLQVFGGTALATGKNLTLVGDIASGVGRTYEDVALWVGRAYDALQSGRPWGEAALRLQEMGALSGAARARLEQLQATGASGTEVWAAFSREMSQFSGMMDKQQHTFEGLASTVRDEFGQALRTATLPIFERLKTALEGLTSPESQAKIQGLAESIAGVADAIGSVVSAARNLNQGLDNLPVLGGLRQWWGDNFGKTMASIGPLGQAAGSAWGDMLGISSSDAQQVGEQLRQQLAHIWQGAALPAEQASFDIKESFTEAGIVVSQTGEGAAVVWVNAAEEAERAADRAANAWRSQLPSALQELGKSMDLALPDDAGNIQKLADMATTATDRANVRIQQTTEGTNTAIGKESAKLQEGMGVLEEWARGTLDACSVAAGEWGSTGAEIVKHILEHRDALLQAKDAAEQYAHALSWSQPNVNAPSAGSAAANALAAYANAQRDSHTAEGSADAATQVAKAEKERADKATQDAAKAKSDADAARQKYLQTPAGQLETAINQAQSQTAIDKLKANSTEFISATVQAEKQSRDARDKLETALKAAGLIEYTSAEREARQHTITAVEFINQQASSVAGTVRSSIDAMVGITKFQIPAGFDAKLDQFADFETHVLQRIQQIGKSYSPDDVEVMAAFATAANQGMALFRSGIDAVNAARDMEPVDDAAVGRAFDGLDLLVKELHDRAIGWKSQADVETAATAAMVGDEVKSITGALDFTAKIADQRTDVRGQINLFFANLSQVLRDFAVYSVTWKTQATDEVATIAKNIGEVADALNKAIDPMTKFEAAGQVTTYDIDAAFANIDYVVKKSSALAASPEFTGQGLKNIQRVSQVLQSAFGGIQSAVDTTVAIGDTQNKVDQGDIQYGFSELYSALAGSGPAGGGGDTYNFYWNGDLVDSDDTDIGTLVKKITSHTSMVRGGVPVGAAAG